MARATVEESSKDLGAYLERVKAGEDVVVVEGDTPIARLSPATEESPDECLRRMERAGRIRLGPGRVPDAFWAVERAKDPKGLAGKALREEREEGRWGSGIPPLSCRRRWASDGGAGDIEIPSLSYDGLIGWASVRGHGHAWREVVGDVRDSAMDLEYTICFCRRGDLVLMLYRNAPPFRNRWNGLGGRIEPGEGLLASVSREVMEESGVDLREATGVRFAGTVRWASRDASPSFPDGGMYVFVAGFPDEWPIWGGLRDGPEGPLCWKPVGWVCDPDNRDVVGNVPRFLPEMLRADGVPLDWRGEYVGWDLVSARSRPLVGRVSL